MKLEEAAKYAADLLLSLPKKSMVRVISHIDADGIAAASIIAIALERAGYRYHISIKRTKPDLIDELKNEENELIIFSDIGSGYLRQMEELKSNIIVLEHHLSYDEPPSNVMYVNARLHGIDGSRAACGASVAYSFAMAIDEANVDLSQLAVVGMIGDKQYFEDYNKKVLEEGIAAGYIEEREEYLFEGKTLKDALENSIEPYFTEMENSNNFLETNGFVPTKKFEELDDEERKKFLSVITLKLLEQGCKDIEWKRKVLYGKYYGNLYEVSSRLNACARLHEAGTGIAYCMGDKRAGERAFILQEKYRDEIRKEMRELEKIKPDEREKYIYFHTDKPPLAGVLAGLALSYLPSFKKGKPVIALSYNEHLDVSARANYEMVNNGINLGEAMKCAAEKVGGNGGGHPVAAGASVPRNMEEKFLEELDKCL
ncbi:MAG: DHH family phosphoesterase [Thermoplasmata archaeon]|nr:DHH family phosphoesterase [Thermoplasmata archaeon]